MKIIDKYLIGRFMTPFFYCVFAFLVLYITYELSINLDEFFKNKVSLMKLTQYYMLRIPVILINSTPLAILLSLLYSLGLMNRHHEIVAMRATGIHIDRIIAPFLLIGAFLAVLIFFVNDQWVCEYSLEESALREEIFDGKKSEVVTIWRNLPFRNPSSNRDWFIESFNFKTSEMSKVTVREFDDNGNIKRKIFAESVKWINNQWWFFDGNVFYYTSEGIPESLFDKGSNQVGSFSRKMMPYKITPEDIENSRRNVTMMNFRALLRYLGMHNKNKKLYRKILVDLHGKIAFPFVCIIAVLIGIPFAIKTQRGGFVKGIGICIFIFLAYYGLSVMFTAMGKSGLLAPFVAVWLPNIIFLIFGYFLVRNAA